MAGAAKCWFCSKRAMKKDKGVTKCRECQSIYWSNFDVSYKGQKGKGDKCWNCSRNTVHQIGIVGSVRVCRCSICSACYVSLPPAMR